MNIVNALREIRRYQRFADLLIPRARFQRLVREISDEFPVYGKTGNLAR